MNISRLLVATIVFLLVNQAMGDEMLSPIPVKEIQLTEHVWKNRVILATYPSNSQEIKKQQEMLSADITGFKDRKLVFMLLTAPTSSSYKKNNFYLIGLDGGKKSQSQKPFILRELFEKIDSMPMRQSELQERQNRK